MTIKLAAGSVTLAKTKIDEIGSFLAKAAVTAGAIDDSIRIEPGYSISDDPQTGAVHISLSIDIYASTETSVLRAALLQRAKELAKEYARQEYARILRPEDTVDIVWQEMMYAYSLDIIEPSGRSKLSIKTGDTLESTLKFLESRLK